MMSEDLVITQFFPERLNSNAYPMPQLKFSGPGGTGPAVPLNTALLPSIDSLPMRK
jgi:hypothetical protein